MDESTAQSPHVSLMFMSVRTDCVDSTSLEARRLAGRPGVERAPFVVVASRQTAGRGRLGRAWASPLGGLWCTFAAPLDSRVTLGGLAPLRVGLAMCRAIENEVGATDMARVRLKWPNDALFDGRKVAGALCERVETPGGPWALAGIGINANFGAHDLPVEVRPRATTLREALGHDVDHDRLVRILEREMAGALALEEDASATLQAIRARLIGVGARSLVTTPTGREELTFLGVEDSGEGRFRDDAGVERRLHSAEIADTPAPPAPSRAR